MGGRGSSYIAHQTSERGLQERAEKIHELMNELGTPAKKTIAETVEILRNSDRRNGLTQAYTLNVNDKDIIKKANAKTDKIYKTDDYELMKMGDSGSVKNKYLITDKKSKYTTTLNNQTELEEYIKNKYRK